MKSLMVLGIGNRIMMDDGIGIQVVEELAKRNTDPFIQYIVGETDIFYCLNEIKEASYSVIVDAAYLGEKPGTLSIIPLQQISETTIKSASAHDSHFINELRIGSKNIKGTFLGIEPYYIDYGTNLSPTLAERFIEIVNHVERIIQHINHNYMDY
ncbi:hydrogenase maturation protease [Acetivibrio cellulolyticus]|uniref:hydrogenase maturation protease n=1 Tax=Acetivibrio cellulolyticus TaxID=35830 RepID=UPI0001E2F070|nr:hydrogenase maturation protease [Acetivibrio cellulolyticus]